MKVFVEGVIMSVEKGEFQDRATGDNIVFFKNWFKADDGEMVSLGSGKTDFSKYEGKKVVITVDARVPQGEKHFKLTIREVRPQGEEDEVI